MNESKKKYITNCCVLKGFEDCQTCGIFNCEYDICPPEEKGKTVTTQYEYYILCDIGEYRGDIIRAKSRLLDRTLTKWSYHWALKGAKNLLELSNAIKQNTKIRKHKKKLYLRRISKSITAYKDLAKEIESIYSNKKKKTTYNYVKRNLEKFSAKSIGKREDLCTGEKVRLLRKKGVKKPFKYCP